MQDFDNSNKPFLPIFMTDYPYLSLLLKSDGNFTQVKNLSKNEELFLDNFQYFTFKKFHEVGMMSTSTKVILGGKENEPRL